ncbi:ferrochelatase [Ornithinicoccus halotolerans]|uniref:ferrochelatase n=1 Tax=Ornithinicoccus halotolerans TaxID=1748220 RepID=UPI001297342B|nr:ferrochelatase [Ornithinicoccus halotolerans]
MTTPGTPGAAAPTTEPYDAIVLISFGGPEAPEEVMPFLRRVTRGRGVPDERLAEVAEHYQHFGGRSPINDQNRALLAAMRAELDRRGIATPLLWGNRNSEPFLTDVLREAHEQGLGRVVAVVTSAYSSYSSCRQYREDIAEALETLQLEDRTLAVDKTRPYFNHPGFSAVNSRLVTEATRRLLRDGGGEAAAPGGAPGGAVTPGEAAEPELPRLVFVTHSIPDAMDETSGPGDGDGRLYSEQHQQLAAAITDEVSATVGRDLVGELVFCSRSGPPSQPWLEPDVNDRLRALAEQGVTRVVLAPIGFVSDHMEVVFDLDTEAVETAAELGLELVRVPTVGVDPEFVSGLVDLVLERAGEARGDQVTRPCWPASQVRPSVCPPGCCPNLRTAKPAACGAD